MQYFKVSSGEKIVPIVSEKIAQRLAEGRHVLWIVTGGSAIKTEAALSHKLQKSDVSNLTVVLTDERFGPVGHADSNWQQLLDAGFSLSGATLVPILNGKDRDETTAGFNKVLAQSFANADFTIGQFGIGPDGHLAGILPGSPNIDTSELAVSYRDDEATPEITPGVYRGKDRITITARTIAKLDEVIVVALGKNPELFDKLEQDIPPAIMPAQLLKQAKNVSVYNDIRGENI